MADKYNQSRNLARHQRIAGGLCRDCGKVSPAEKKVICTPCSNKRLVTSKRQYNKTIINNLCRRCRNPNLNDEVLCPECKPLWADNQRKRRYAIKIFVVNHYGGKCVDCGENDIRCLTLDHINNDGYQEITKRNRATWYRKLVSDIKKFGNAWRELQLRCFNCHAKKDLFSVWDKHYDTLANS